MIIGIAQENREESEKRVVLLPSYVSLLVSDGHTVRVETGAGEKLGISDKEYKKAGAIISSREEVYGADMVVRIRVANSEELDLMKPGSILVCMVHRDTHPELVADFKRRKVAVFELNEVRDENGKRLIGVLDLTGCEGIKAGFALYKKLYHKNPINIVIMGCGGVGASAIRTASKLGAVVKVLGRMQTTKEVIKQNLTGAHILVNATYRKPEEIGKYLVTKNDLSVMDKQSLVVDLAADPISCIETCHPTSLDDPYYFVEINGRKIPHQCIYSLPGLAPLACVEQYSKQITPYLRLIAGKGVKKTSSESQSVINAFITS